MPAFARHTGRETPAKCTLASAIRSVVGVMDQPRPLVRSVYRIQVVTQAGSVSATSFGMARLATDTLGTAMRDVSAVLGRKTPTVPPAYQTLPGAMTKLLGH
jgi:hypothetical protein